MASTEDVTHLAALARISVDPARAEAFQKEFSDILAYIGQLDELTVPNAGGTPVAPKLHNVFRKDEEPYAPLTWTQKLIAAFPFKSGNLLSVKKIITHD